MAEGESEDFAAALNVANIDGWVSAMGLRLIRATGRMRLLVLEPDAALAGQRAGTPG